MTQIIGISAYYHDSAVAFIRDGEIIRAAQEERYTRVKHDASFPTNALEFCLSGLALETIDAVVFYDKPLLKFERLLETYLASAPKGFMSFAKAMPIWLKEKLYLKSVLRTELRKIVHRQRAMQNGSSLIEEREKDKKPKIPKLLFCEHHESHAAAAYFPSPFDDAVILCLDGVGEWATSSAWRGKSGQLSPLFEIHFPHSLGLLYSAFTQYCGFRVNSGEYKLMGLAPYGKPKYVDKIKQHLVHINADGSFSLDMKYFDYASGKTMTNAHFHDLFDGPANAYDGEISQKEMDLARSIQVVTEDIVLAIAKHLHTQTGASKLCLAGGVALNCVANGRLLREGPFEDIWIQPAAGDAGSAIGAALQIWHKYYGNEKRHAAKDHFDAMRGAYLGNRYCNQEVIDACVRLSLTYKQLAPDEVIDTTVTAIDSGRVVGWFQGEMEFGPRALGNRSIIGDPRNATMQAQMNLKIKQRESFRPFAPAVLEEDVSHWFDLSTVSPYMLLVADVKKAHHSKIVKAHKHKQQHNDSHGDVHSSAREVNETTDLQGLDKVNEIRSTVPAITHVDYSARVQTVSEHTNPKFHKLIKRFKAVSGIGMLINTSFNVRGEPPVCSPDDAIRCFLATDMDLLVMEDIVLDKKIILESANGQQQIAAAKAISFEMD
ncbi:carbamoyltransferase [Glaciecola sp. MH2013]|uniref:carbamoyltransferase family protein n=1 Tax=Glaciecola sp. MH2013 TaxID=2785524 RepID=UPI00189D0844|nr:carbamoyltransferase [Glaciecola sp. MH2013]MBF7072687.1 carbamoyltransferase [Glaciecola sp. MH2013]